MSDYSGTNWDPTRDMHADILSRAFRARLEAAKLTGDKLVQDYREKTAHCLLSAGLNLIPSEHLNDNQFVVSLGVYEAAKRLVSEKGTTL